MKEHETIKGSTIGLFMFSLLIIDAVVISVLKLIKIVGYSWAEFLGNIAYAFVSEIFILMILFFAFTIIVLTIEKITGINLFYCNCSPCKQEREENIAKQLLEEPQTETHSN